MYENELKIFKEFDTIAIAPHYDGANLSLIYTYQGIFSSKETVTNLMDQFCMLYGSDLNGRLNASRKRLGIRKKPPIIISELKEIGAFQVPVPFYNESMWIIDLDFEIQRMESNKCEIYFTNDLKLEIALSESVMKLRRNNTFALLYEVKNIHNRKRLQFNI